MKSTTFLSLVALALATDAPAGVEVAKADSQEKFFWFHDDSEDDNSGEEDDCGCDTTSTLTDIPPVASSTNPIPQSTLSSSSASSVSSTSTPHEDSPVPGSISSSKSASSVPSSSSKSDSTTKVVVPETVTISSTTLETITSCSGNGTCHSTISTSALPSSFTDVESANGVAALGVALGGVVAALIM